MFDLVLFGMLFVKIWQHAHRMTGGARSRLLKILHRDGFIYFIVILGNAFYIALWDYDYVRGSELTYAFRSTDI